MAKLLTLREYIAEAIEVENLLKKGNEKTLAKVVAGVRNGSFKITDKRGTVYQLSATRTASTGDIETVIKMANARGYGLSKENNKRNIYGIDVLLLTIAPQDIVPQS